MLRRLVWSSVPSADFDTMELNRIAVPWARNNERTHVSGTLLFTGAQFLGVFEGHEHDLESLWLQLERDRRHRSIARLANDRCGQRRFPHWSFAVVRKAAACGALMPYKTIRWPRRYLPASGSSRVNSFLTTS